MSLKIFALLFLVGYAHTEGIAIEQILSLCCNEGDEWGITHLEVPCSSFNKSLELVPRELHGLCLSTIEICCSKQHKIYQCSAGQLAARQGLSCQLAANTAGGSEFFTDCCEACKIGLVVGSGANKCSVHPFAFGTPWDDVYEACCREIKNEETFILNGDDENDLCSRFDRLCSQICKNTDSGSYVCKCYNGFQLLEDGKTCVAATPDLDYENFIQKNSSDCQSGYEKDPKTGECKDIDECETGSAACDPTQQACYNVDGSYKCLDIVPESSECSEGFRYNSKTEECQDINECDDNSACDEGFKCVNYLGSYECIRIPKRQYKPTIPIRREPCALGFRRQNDQCVDVDECANDKNACDSNQVCTNEIGGFRCDCKLGFILDPITNACVDINECQINNHECLESQRCDNTIGSYTCIRLQSCGTGYTLNAETGNCDDDDECTLKTHNCQLPYECKNTRGSFRCIRQRSTTTEPTTTTTTTVATTTKTTTPRPERTTPYQHPHHHQNHHNQHNQHHNNNNEEYNRYLGSCGVGFERNHLGACTDINECSQGGVCRNHQRCVNTNGSYRCENLLSCPVGSVSNPEGTTCIDVDECQTGEAACGPDQVCKNKRGGYVCLCPPGHVIGTNRRCEDLNECELHDSSKICPSNAECVNTVGSYLCECKEGFKKNRPDDRVCSDVDECTEVQGLCHQICVNYWGSYRCACHSGFKLNDNNRTCDDVDECEEYKNSNLCMGICENTPGSYVCNCPPGYRLGTDNRSCQDIDECETQSVCKGRHEICTNTRGSYRCTRIDCPYDYMIDPERKNRCKRISVICDRDDLACFQKPSSYSYNFITIVSNMSVPPQGRALFNLKGPAWYENIDFDLEIVNVDATPFTKKANSQSFSMTKMQNEVFLNLVKSLEGQQDIELNLSMTVYKDGQPIGSNVAKIFLMVSEHTF